MKNFTLMKVFDVIKLKKKHLIFDEWFRDNSDELNNDTGVEYILESDPKYKDSLYYRLDETLIKLGAEDGETVILYVSW